MTARAFIALALLSSCAYHPRPVIPAMQPYAVPVASVLPFTDGYTLCTAVVVDTHEALTAAYCAAEMPRAVLVLADGTPLHVTTREVPGGLVALHSSTALPEPARMGAGRVAYVAGYGCASDLSPDGWYRLQLDVREVAAGTCDGDSGGGEFNAAGELVRIVQGKTHKDGRTTVTVQAIGWEAP